MDKRVRVVSGVIPPVHSLPLSERRRVVSLTYTGGREMLHNEMLHKETIGLGIGHFVFNAEDNGMGSVWEYIWISDREYRFFRVGNMPTNYVLR